MLAEVGLASAMVLAANAAVAKPASVEPLRSMNPASLARTSTEFNIGPAGAMLERDYFRAADTDFYSGRQLCRFEPSMFAKVRLTETCR
jgi:hypothetical protein